ncbi:MAG: PA14 domain-containing protein, partial [Bacteroidota bacterium]|nr:PA14 domain-containing protein [Bacteroidota bacterium]
MKISTRILLAATIVLAAAFGAPVRAQSILNPNDTVFTYNPAAPPTQPAGNTIGKWVRTVRVGWNTNNYKCYIYNGFPFRLRFPKSYNPTANDGKKYPILIFFHGAGEAGPVTDNEFSLFHGGQVFDNAVTNGTFDGYVFVMQTQNGFWGQPVYNYIQQILDYMVVNNKLDPFRINLNGLSGGGAGTWDMGIAFPNYTAGMVPMSAASLDYLNTAPPALKFIPVWLIQGGLDGSPDPSTTQQLVNAMNNAGANLKYQIFPNDAHDTWDDTWNQPTFWPFMNGTYASNPWPLFGRSQFCTGDSINMTVGVAAGYQAYQWRMNGNVIAGATSNSINVTQLGTYDARVERNGVWSDWSHTPLVVGIKPPTVSPNITIPALSSNVRPALDTTTGVTLTVPTGYASYNWQAVGGSSTLSTTNTLFTNNPGQYHVQVTEQFGCSSSFSNPYTVIAANGPNPPSAAANLIVTPISQTSLRLDWTVNPSQPFPQTGFEVYQATNPAGPFKIIDLPGANATSDTAKGLLPAATYYYKVRAVNGTAAAAASNTASGTTTSDNQPPTAPTNLTVTGTTRTSISIGWSPSTDNVGVTKYDIYVNGVKIGSDTSGTTFTIYNLKFGTTYAIAVTARDFAGNISPFSNQVTGQCLQTGWSFKYYTFTGTWNTLPNLATMTPVKTGFSTSLDLGTRTQDNNFAYLFEGFLHVPVTGTYTFRTNSDDGSTLYLGALGQTSSAYNFPTAPLVNNDGLHGTQDRNSNPVTLQAGVYPIAVAFYQQGGGFSVTASWSTPQTGAGNFVQIPLSALSDTATVNGQAPAAPTNLVATTAGTNKIGLSWTDNSSNETAFEIWKASDSLGLSFTTIATIPANRVSFVDSSASPATRYWYKVRAIGQFGQSAFDKAGPGMGYKYYALAASPSILPSPAQLNNTVPTATGVVSTISVAPAQATTNFILAFSGVINIPTAGAYTFFTSSDDGSDLYVDGTDSAHLVVKNDFLQGQTERSGVVTLSAGPHTIFLPYFQAGGGFVVTASIQGPGLSKQQIPASMMGQPFSNATTLPQVGAPTAPTGLVAHGTSTASSVTLSWNDNATNENSYQVFRSSNNNLNYVLLATLPANTVSYRDTGLFANAVFFYKVRAANQGGNSAFSNEDSAHTADVLPVLAPVAAQYMHFGTQLVLNLSATVNSSDALTLTVSNLPAFASFSSTGNGKGTITFNPAQSDQGVYNTIGVTATDQHGGSVSQTLSLTVNSNFNPVIGRPVNNVSVNEQQTAVVNLSATDQNAGDALTFSFIGLPGFASTVLNGGSAQLTLAPGFADGGSYTVQARVDDGNHGFDTLSFTITVVPVPLPITNVFVHFSDGSSGTVAGSPWNNTAAVPVQNLAFPNLLDQNGANSGLALTITSPWQNVSPANGSNTFGATTGNNSGVYPDAVLSSAYYTDANNQTIRVSGMDTSTKYSFTFLGSRGGVNDDRTTVYSVTNTGGTSSVSLQAANNTANTVSVNNVQPNADGTVLLTLARGTNSSFGYLNALVIGKQFNDHTAPARARNISGQFVNNQVALTWTAAAYNANSYQVYRSVTRSGGYTLLNPGAANPTQAAYADTTISQNNTYFYYVTATNAYGVSPSSDTVTMVIPNLSPVLAAIAPVTVSARKTATATVSASDPGDAITLQATGLPGFATFTDNGGGNGSLSFAPANTDVGVYSATITATDNHGASSTTPLSITVTAVTMRNVYINMNDGSSSEPAQGAPWNNMNSAPNAGAGIANLKDDSAFSTGFGITLVDTWSGANNVGP